MKTRHAEAPLAGIRVLDLTDDSGLLAGQLLAELGADVVQVVAHPESVPQSAHRRAYLRGKRILELDISIARSEFEALLQNADVLIDSHAPAIAARFALDPPGVAKRFGQLIHASITPFGCTGPKANYAATDLIINAASGFLFLSGAAGGAPLRISVPQAHAHAGADAAVAIMIALRGRDETGVGEHLDVSAQHSLTLALLGRGLDAAVGQTRAERASGAAQVGAVTVRSLYALRDGWAMVTPGILPPVAPFMRRLMEWAVQEGFATPELVAWDWGTVAVRMMQGVITSAQWAPVEDAIERLLAPLTKAQVMAAAVQRKLLLAPVLHLGELLTSEHFVARDFVRGPPGNRHLGPFAHFSASPLQQPNETTKVTAAQLAAAWSPRATTRAGVRGTRASAPLAGLKVLDLFWVVAGPGATRMLADYGATVVHVESRTRLDMLRSVPPYIDGVMDPERAAGFHSINANKLGLALDLSTEAGRGVLADLIRWADVLGESFSPGVIARLGFDYATVKRLNPRLIMISSSLLGQTGPWRDYAGFGNLAGAVSGFYQLTGHPDAPPTGCFGPYTDFMGVRFNALAILAALAHRDRTGEGQYIDMAQSEAALHFLAPAAQQFLAAARVPRANGNRDDAMAPHGVFPCAGHDTWVSIAVADDAQWQRLCGHAQLLELGADAALVTLAGRQQAHARIEDALSAWTRQRDAAAIEMELQQLGIAAHRLADTSALAADPQLQSRDFVREIGHPQFGHTAIESSRVIFSRSHAAVPESAVTYGSHDEVVLRDMLHYSQERIEQLVADGVLK